MLMKFRYIYKNCQRQGETEREMSGEKRLRDGEEMDRECVSQIEKKCLVRQKVRIEVNKYRGTRETLPFPLPCTLVIITVVHSRWGR